MGSSSPLKMQLESWNYCHCHGNMHSGIFRNISSLYPFEALCIFLQRVEHVAIDWLNNLSILGPAEICLHMYLRVF